MKRRHDTQMLVSSQTFAPTHILENAIIHGIHIRKNPQQLFLAAKIATLHQEDKNKQLFSYNLIYLLRYDVELCFHSFCSFWDLTRQSDRLHPIVILHVCRGKSHRKHKEYPITYTVLKTALNCFRLEDLKTIVQDFLAKTSVIPLQYEFSLRVVYLGVVCRCSLKSEAFCLNCTLHSETNGKTKSSPVPFFPAAVDVVKSTSECN